MNCDDAFEAMTDPACENPAELDWHLDLCPRCRQMREVLAPALDRLISVGDDAHSSQTEDDFLPAPPDRRESSPFLSAEAVRIAERAAADVVGASARPTEASASSASVRAPRRRALVRYIAVALLGATVSLSVMGAFVTPRSSDTPAADDRCTWIHRSDAKADKPESSRTLVLSCAACHLEGTVK